MGKVHGSLARAGKVKSQTPKVRPSSISASFEEAERTPRGEDDWVAKQRLKALHRKIRLKRTRKAGEMG